MTSETHTDLTGTNPLRRGIAKTTCLVMGVLFLIVAVWGFIDGDNVLIFHVNAAHNMVHLLSGIAALACAFAGEQVARIFCWTFGLTYGLVALLGFAGVTVVEDLLHLNPADDWLHVGITLVFLLAAALSTRNAPARAGIPRIKRAEHRPSLR
ncbi:MAG TPA: DUF4383 domain-containing protein [Phycisphaerales bacterium]|nr:DUF4383 domain-containing protein [Phycisphaerales bacterium]